jgi:hypothetical protein
MRRHGERQKEPMIARGVLETRALVAPKPDNAQIRWLGVLRDSEGIDTPDRCPRLSELAIVDQ